ncbi:MAG: hypothetical protein ACOCQQ_02720, partial [Candidatus Nanoarchaeia archaeon]
SSLKKPVHSTSSKKKVSQQVPSSMTLKNKRRIQRLRQKKTADQKIHELKSALQVEQASKDELRDQLSTLQTHVVAYKQRFEESLAHQAQQKKHQQVQSQREVRHKALENLSNQLHSVESSTESLFFEKKLSLSSRKEILSLITALNKAIDEKKKNL